MEAIADEVAMLSIASPAMQRRSLGRAFDAYVTAQRSWLVELNTLSAEGASDAGFLESMQSFRARMAAIVDEIDSLGIDRSLMTRLSDAFVPVVANPSEKKKGVEAVTAFLSNLSQRLRDEG